ncbi:MAG: PmoA family protein [Candidatus Aminicenantes bacterium]|nr:MAG: PmoA family protein [Candidatus Aminicenantes bacterium]
MKPIVLIIFIIGMILSAFASQMTFVEDAEKGTLTVRDGQVEVLTYRFGDQLKKGVDPKQTRSCYIHPLYSLDGKALTEDFPQDHLHHHGVSWTWPIVRTRGQDTQTWHPANLRQYFVRWHEREAKDNEATLRVENAWKLDGREVVAREIVTLHVHPAADEGRAIDVEIRIEAVGGPLTLQGTPDQNKGYGGFSLRGAPMFKGAGMTTDQGPLEKDSTNMAFRWADISTQELGVAIFVSPDHHGFPTTWLIRNSYAGFINASWPGLKPTTLQPGEKVTLRYRVYIHRGDATAGHVRQAYHLYHSRKHPHVSKERRYNDIP